MSVAADPAYDLQGALGALLPGVVLQRQLLDAAAARYAAKGFLPLAAGDVAAILAAAAYPAALPVYPSGLPRLAESNPARDGWARDSGREVP